ncbi:unnamed protein product [Echinostoma caproni]|uniref:Reverse transcriptase n=1 Tax=Echinostoma caproni TaxID=27848 RepID=A0A183B4R3_9TREM|nr:unnamed protein product [Echinostoma caproni]
MSLHTSSLPNVHTRLQRLIVQCSNNKGGMGVRLVKLEVEGEPVFLKRRVIPYGQREGVLKALEKMEHDGILTRVTSSAWATPIVIAMKSADPTTLLRILSRLRHHVLAGAAEKGGNLNPGWIPYSKTSTNLASGWSTALADGKQTGSIFANISQPTAKHG